MVINLKNLETKLQAIKDKNLDKIIAKNIRLPYLGQRYTKTELQNWLNKRSDFLIKLRDSKGENLTTEKDAIYSSLSTKRQLLANDILEGKNVEEETEDDWEELVLLKLYRFVTEE